MGLAVVGKGLVRPAQRRRHRRNRHLLAAGGKRVVPGHRAPVDLVIARVREYRAGRQGAGPLLRAVQHLNALDPFVQGHRNAVGLAVVGSGIAGGGQQGIVANRAYAVDKTVRQVTAYAVGRRVLLHRRGIAGNVEDQGSVTAGKSAFADARHARGNRHIRQAAAPLKSRSADTRHAALDHNLLDRASPRRFIDAVIGHLPIAGDRQQAVFIQRPGEVIAVCATGAAGDDLHLKGASHRHVPIGHGEAPDVFPGLRGQDHVLVPGNRGLGGLIALRGRHRQLDLASRVGSLGARAHRAMLRRRDLHQVTLAIVIGGKRQPGAVAAVGGQRGFIIGIGQIVADIIIAGPVAALEEQLLRTAAAAVAVGQIHQIIAPVGHGNRVPHVPTRAGAVFHHARNQDALDIGALEAASVAQVLEGLGIALANHVRLGAAVPVKDINQLPGIAVGGRGIVRRGVVVAHQAADRLGIARQLLQVAQGSCAADDIVDIRHRAADPGGQLVDRKVHALHGIGRRHVQLHGHAGEPHLDGHPALAHLGRAAGQADALGLVEPVQVIGAVVEQRVQHGAKVNALQLKHGRVDVRALQGIKAQVPGGVPMLGVDAQRRRVKREARAGQRAARNGLDFRLDGPVKRHRPRQRALRLQRVEGDAGQGALMPEPPAGQQFGKLALEIALQQRFAVVRRPGQRDILRQTLRGDLHRFPGDLRRFSFRRGILRHRQSRGAVIGKRQLRFGIAFLDHGGLVPAVRDLLRFFHSKKIFRFRGIFFRGRGFFRDRGFFRFSGIFFRSRGSLHFGGDFFYSGNLFRFGGNCFICIGSIFRHGGSLRLLCGDHHVIAAAIRHFKADGAVLDPGFHSHGPAVRVALRRLCPKLRVGDLRRIQAPKPRHGHAGGNIRQALVARRVRNRHIEHRVPHRRPFWQKRRRGLFKAAVLRKGRAKRQARQEHARRGAHGQRQIAQRRRGVKGFGLRLFDLLRDVKSLRLRLLALRRSIKDFALRNSAKGFGLRRAVKGHSALRPKIDLGILNCNRRRLVHHGQQGLPRLDALRQRARKQRAREQYCQKCRTESLHVHRPPESSFTHFK